MALRQILRGNLCPGHLGIVQIPRVIGEVRVVTGLFEPSQRCAQRGTSLGIARLRVAEDRSGQYAQTSTGTTVFMIRSPEVEAGRCSACCGSSPVRRDRIMHVAAGLE